MSNNRFSDELKSRITQEKPDITPAQMEALEALYNVAYHTPVVEICTGDELTRWKITQRIRKEQHLHAFLPCDGASIMSHGPAEPNGHEVGHWGNIHFLMQRLQKNNRWERLLPDGGPQKICEEIRAEVLAERAQESANSGRSQPKNPVWAVKPMPTRALALRLVGGDDEHLPSEISPRGSR